MLIFIGSYEFNSCLRILHGGYSLKAFMELREASFTLVNMLFPYKKAV